MAFSARGATKDAARFRRRRALTPLRCSLTLPADFRERDHAASFRGDLRRKRSSRVSDMPHRDLDVYEVIHH
jgi:hypothetical protein